MATFYKSTRLWVIDFTYDGRPRRWIKPLPEREDGRTLLKAEVLELYGKHASVLDVRPASTEEEVQFVRGEAPKNVLCPTGRPAGAR